jgi:flagellar hook-basal body complex protein FliE
MDISAFNALKTYGSAQKVLTPEGAKLSTPKDGKEEFNLSSVTENLVGAVAKSETAASAYMTGKADPHSVVEAIASAELAVETAVTLRNRVVEAYQELLRMPI